MTARNLQRLVILIALILAPALALAQTGELTGRVTDTESGTPLVGATVRVVPVAQTTRQLGGVTDRGGEYRVRGLSAGRFRVSITYLSYSSFETEIYVEAGEDKRLDAALTQGALGLDEVVVSASRQPEKITDAPASVSVVSAREVDAQPAVTVVDHIRDVPGLDIVQSGISHSNVVTRGFNNAGSGSLMVMTDNRIAGVPSLRVNIYDFIPLVNEDIQQIEIVRGPGAALYGPNTANGVMHMVTRSPFSSQGTWFSLAGGERQLLHGMVRHAGTLGDRVGFKISAQYMTASDWPYVDSAEAGARAQAIAANDTAEDKLSRIGIRDQALERIAGELRVDVIPVEDMTAILSVGLNRSLRSVDLTGVGAAQVDDWQYAYYQARFLYKDFFFQGFLNQSDAGVTYLIRTGEPVVDRSRLFVAQAQHSARPIDELSLTYGVDFLSTVPVTDRTITGGNEDDDETTEIGGYLQARASLAEDLLELTGAGRIDFHSRIEEPIFSPRVALVYTPIAGQTARAAYNRAYSAPTTSEMFLDIVAGSFRLFDVRATGVPESGFTFAFDGDRPIMHSRFLPSGRPLANDPLLWEGVRALVKEMAEGSTDSLFRLMAEFIDDAPTPSGEEVGVELRWLNPTTGAFDAEGEIAGRDRIRPTINQTLEVGYHGLLGERISMSLDVYRSHYTDFVGPLETITPNVFYNTAQFRTWAEGVLRAGGIPDPDARLFAAAAAARLAGIPGDKENAGIPLATITPVEATDSTAVMLTYRNYGDIVIYGMDLGLRAGLLDDLYFSGSLSIIDKNFFANLDNVGDLSLNAPKFKFVLGLEYDQPKDGLHLEARVRHVDGFIVRSGVFNGEVKGYTVVDASGAYEIPWVKNMTLAVSAQNILTWVQGEGGSPLTQKHAEFASVPPLGRMVVVRASYAL